MAASYNIKVKQGSTFKLDFKVKVDTVYQNFTSYTGRMQVRSDYSSPTKYLDMKTSNGQITMDSSGNVHFLVPATTMAAIPAGRYVYDFEVESAGGEVTPILEGRFTVLPEVTK